MKIALGQINTTVGDFAGNSAKILQAYQRGVEEGASIVLTPELSLCGYPPRDLLSRAAFLHGNLSHLGTLAAKVGNTALLVGFVGENKIGVGLPITNSVALLQNGSILLTRTKTLLPSYDVFDEARYFEPAMDNFPIDLGGMKVGVTICEDIWNDEDFWDSRLYKKNPPIDLARQGVEMILNISASPWHLGKTRVRQEMLSSLARKIRKPIAYCNLIGANDELVFDGGSMVFNGIGDCVARGKRFEEDFLVVDPFSSAPVSQIPLTDAESIYGALVIGIRDYFEKTGFKTAVLGLSGGIDSAVVACLAVEALGAKAVRGISMPSQYSSQGSLDDARILAQNLGIKYDVVPIGKSFEMLKSGMAQVFEGRAEDTAEENMQARLRGVILMAMSNKFGSLVLTTGNKSELAVGYCTLYGDMCGALAAISDVPKTMVYKLAKFINRNRTLIPVDSISKPPSAELRPNQTDQDSLPPYEVLDNILELYVVKGLSGKDIISAGHDSATVKRIINLINVNEYKRRQAAPGLKVTSKAFGMGRRIPLAQRYREIFE
ncbi:MAG: nad+ synthetase [Verrucomicrobiales bacterium]|nr:nad+ synthetase [Verrucomicrobiales bacterium]